MKRIYNIGLKILIFAVLTFALFTSLTSRFAVEGIRSYVVLTGSMEPNIPTKSLVYVQNQPKYYVGDIITFKRGQIDITHRIAGIKNIGKLIAFQTKGDANKSADPQVVYAGSIVGKVIIKAPIIGNIVLLFKTIPGFLILIALPTILFIGFEIKEIKEEFEKEVEKKVLGRIKTESI